MFLEMELGLLYVGLLNFRETFFGGVDLQMAPYYLSQKYRRRQSALQRRVEWMAYRRKGERRTDLVWRLIPNLEAFMTDCIRPLRIDANCSRSQRHHYKAVQASGTWISASSAMTSYIKRPMRRMADIVGRTSSCRES